MAMTEQIWRERLVTAWDLVVVDHKVTDCVKARVAYRSDRWMRILRSEAGRQKTEAGINAKTRRRREEEGRSAMPRSA